MNLLFQKTKKVNEETKAEVTKDGTLVMKNFQKADVGSYTQPEASKPRVKNSIVSCVWAFENLDNQTRRRNQFRGCWIDHLRQLGMSIYLLSDTSLANNFARTKIRFLFIV